MTFLARIVRFLFWLLIVSWSMALLRRFVGKMSQRAQPSNSAVDVPSDATSKKLVRDPVCGMHIAEGIALTARQGNELVYFCSADCRDQYVSKTRKFAANA
jgi:YHS domain-containing protein